jgi:transposase InsO family protein
LRSLEHDNRKVRGDSAQRARRELERTLRTEVVAFVRWTRHHSLTLWHAASRLRLCSRTISTWMHDWPKDHLRVEPRGRPAQRTDRETRDGVIALFQLMGPGVGLPVLQEIFPGVARRELEDLQRRYRDAHLKKNRVLVHTLRWRKIGAVWAMDYTEPPCPIDGIYRSILLVRDLSSGAQLLALPVPSADAGQTVAALKSLFVEHGPPFVLKSDNGSALTAGEVEALLDGRHVYHLLSPPRLPSYNGACEAGIGSLKTRAHHESARNDRAGEWSCDDIEAARLMANVTSRPGGFHAPTPNEQWRIRLVLSPRERELFRSRVEAFRAEEQKASGFLPGIDPGPAAHAKIDRRAITRALVAHGILNFRRRRITLPIYYAKSAGIS